LLLLATGPRDDVSVAEDGRGGGPEHSPDVGGRRAPAVVDYDVIGRNQVVRALADELSLDDWYGLLQTSFPLTTGEDVGLFTLLFLAFVVDFFLPLPLPVVGLLAAADLEFFL